MNKELRLIVTRKCNFNCYFCHGEGVEKDKKEFLTCDDYTFLVKFCKDKYGWDTVTLTGGEPLIRRDIDKIIDSIYNLGIKLTIVSNGELISNHIETLKKIDRLNVSIHSFDKEKYSKIIQRNNKLERVLLNLAQLRNLNPDISIRINTTIIKNQNDTIEDYKRILKFAEDLKASIKIIELFSENNDEIVKIEEIKNMFLKLGFKIYNVYNHKIGLYNGKTKVILSKIFCAAASNMYSPDKYCNINNDLFISPDGNIKLCRYIKEEVSILEEIKRRDIEGLNYKMNMAKNLLGKNCPLVKKIIF